MLTFRVDEELASELAAIPERSNFVREALERALDRRPPPVRSEAVDSKA
jgi:hypothetical protein